MIKCGYVVLFLLQAMISSATAGEGAAAKVEENVLTVSAGTIEKFIHPEGAANVLLFISVDCPISNKYVPEFNRLIESFESKNMKFWLVYPDDTTTPEQIQQHARDYHLNGSKVRDPEHLLVAKSGAVVTPEAAVYDKTGTLIYRGRIDDRFPALGSERAKASHGDLAEILEKILRGEKLTFQETRAIGCRITTLR